MYIIYMNLSNIGLSIDHEIKNSAFAIRVYRTQYGRPYYMSKLYESIGTG